MQDLSNAPALAVSLGWDALRLGVWLVLLAVLFIPLERLLARHRQPVLRKSFGADLCLYFLNNLVPKLVLVVPLTLAARAAHHLLPGTFYGSVGAWPLWLRVAAGMLVGELGAYWAHRWSHENALLWRFHAVHHEAEEMDWLVHTRAHPADMVFTRLCALVPLYLLGLAQPLGGAVDTVPFLVTLAGTVWGFLIHANLNLRLGWLEQVIASPAFHHWHHTNDGPHLVNKNYAPLLPWVDRLFGTFYLPSAWPEKYGIEPSQPSALPDVGGQGQLGVVLRDERAIEGLHG